MGQLEKEFYEISKEKKLKFYALYTYDLKSLPKSKAVRFVYLLKGRGKDTGIISENKGVFLAPGCFIIPVKNEKEIQEIFESWKIKHKRRLMLTH